MLQRIAHTAGTTSANVLPKLLSRGASVAAVTKWVETDAETLYAPAAETNDSDFEAVIDADSALPATTSSKPPGPGAGPHLSGPPHRVVVISAGGSQGSALAAQALHNAAREQFEVALHTREPAGAARHFLVRCGDRSLDLAEHSRARRSSGVIQSDPADTLVVDATVVAGLHDTIAWTPPGSSVLYIQNGMPSHVDEKAARGLEPHQAVSMVTTTAHPGEGVAVAPGGVMMVDENDRLVDTLHRVFRDQGFFRLVNVPDIRATRFEKVALNCAINVTATLFGQPLGELRAKMRRDHRCERLIAGIASEVCAVAGAQGVRTRPADRVMADIESLMERFPAHPTSMRAAFDAGAPTEIGVLNAAVCRLGAELGVATPLNRIVCARLAEFESWRDAGASPAGFHMRHAEAVARATEELLALAAAVG
ncbi:ketopantoate reductase family protein [Xylophilus sp. GOD-11R]|uniref:ketopantoate reductase family protein n=1 Tax=Xylophilus sp. GOD-11R TaxID=3089814 RepID=UPI00298C8DB7|nr:ketopantoate reductase C-terminal domain-containing protein [Xylophilus sp. GOD-11R]WPB56505.1 ketopantoate reductase C-terminal domain-containing protein [Xylophilus sp. GOD-11R]